MSKPSQQKVNNSSLKYKLTNRLSSYRSVFITLAFNAGLNLEEVALIFGTTKQNVFSILKKTKDGKGIK